MYEPLIVSFTFVQLISAFVTFGTLYFLVPKLVGASDLYSKRLANIHFWLALMGVLIYQWFYVVLTFQFS
jgi:cbb3-type cytochrome oxidase subunit 1